jgi:hypothetical protein
MNHVKMIFSAETSCGKNNNNKFNIYYLLLLLPVTVAARSEAWNIFARSSTGIMGSHPARGMDVCLRLFCVCVVPCR